MGIRFGVNFVVALLQLWYISCYLGRHACAFILTPKKCYRLCECECYCCFLLPKKILFTRNISCSRHLNLFHNFHSPSLQKLICFFRGGLSICCLLLSVVSVAVRLRVNCKAFSIETGFTFTSAWPGSATRTLWTSRLPQFHRAFCLFCSSFHSAELLRMAARDLWVYANVLFWPQAVCIDCGVGEIIICITLCIHSRYSLEQK